jgi:hypothetical protein
MSVTVDALPKSMAEVMQLKRLVIQAIDARGSVPLTQPVTFADSVTGLTEDQIYHEAQWLAFAWDWLGLYPEESDAVPSRTDMWARLDELEAEVSRRENV